MTRKRTISDKTKVVRNIKRIIRYWLEGRYARVAPYLDDDVIMYLPHLKCRIAGKKDALAALRKSRECCDIRRYCEQDFKVETSDNVSFAHCRYSLEYEGDVQRIAESGSYLLVLQNRSAKWRIIRWSMMTTESGVRRVECV